MNSIKQIFFAILLVIFFQTNLFSQSAHFVDFKYILNESKAGKEAQTYLKNKLENGIKNLRNKEKTIQKEEEQIIKQKKLLSA